jgi:hypothetical protein
MLKAFGVLYFIGINMKTKTPIFPFLGSLSDGETFEYLYTKGKDQKITIGIYDWFVNRVKLHLHGCVDLHMPVFSEKIIISKSSLGRVTKITEEKEGVLYEVTLSENQERQIPQISKIFKNEKEILDYLKFLIKDTIILKQGVIVYLNHLIPYFSRTSAIEDQIYQKLEEQFLRDIESHVKKNESRLQHLLDEIEKLKNLTEIPVYLNLEEIREIFESEISLTLFNVVFGENVKKSTLFKNTASYGIVNYINAIKNLEKRLYVNYNLIVLIYIKVVT